MKNYKLSFDIWGLLLFLIIMIPNFIWFSIPAPNDVLRADSITEVVDTIASICQVLMIIALCIFVNKRGHERGRQRRGYGPEHLPVRAPRRNVPSRRRSRTPRFRRKARLRILSRARKRIKQKLGGIKPPRPGHGSGDRLPTKPASHAWHFKV